MAALVSPSSSAIICNDVPAKLCRVNRSTAASISRVRVSAVPSATVAMPAPQIGQFHLYDRMVRYLPFVKLVPLRSARNQRLHVLDTDRQHAVGRVLDASSESLAHLLHGGTQPLRFLIGRALEPHSPHPHRHHLQDNAGAVD